MLELNQFYISVNSINIFICNRPFPKSHFLTIESKLHGILKGGIHKIMWIMKTYNWYVAL